MKKQLTCLIALLLTFPIGALAVDSNNDEVTQIPPAQADSDLKAEPTLKPISGAFGLQLGEHFKASMVAKVLSKQGHAYTGPGKTKLKGSLLRIEPVQPDKRFQKYSVKISDTGIIYAIQGDYQYKVKQEISPSDSAEPEETKPRGKGKGLGKPGNKQQANAIQKTCKAAVKTMAKELESQYGKPRGQGWDGLWFAFRQFSDSSNKGLKLYGHRCRTGMYSIIYSDETVRRKTLPVKTYTPE